MKCVCVCVCLCVCVCVCVCVCLVTGRRVLTRLTRRRAFNLAAYVPGFLRRIVAARRFPGRTAA